jgi:8-oxo-dGTP pyrophosphatase MutT (NUDIX family)
VTSKKVLKQKAEPRSQVAALPVFTDEAGVPWVMLITSRETKRWIIPKGWPMKGRTDQDAAAQEAREEAGIIGRVHDSPVGTYTYWKRQSDHIELCEVSVYLLEVKAQLSKWREKGQRELDWLPVAQAAERVDEPGLRDIIRRVVPRPSS